jgi:GNAT superfamily N-acetyltransferase
VNRYEIRHLEPGDSLDDLTSLVHRAFGRMGRSGLECTAVEQSVDVTSRRARRGDCLVALAHGRIVGTVTLEHPRRISACRWYRRPEVASLHQFAVDPADQGLGCGKALLQAAQLWACRHGYRELALDAPASASHLISFCKLQGFRIVGEMQMPNRHYRSAILSKTVSRSTRPSRVWRSPHRAAWFGDLVRS